MTIINIKHQQLQQEAIRLANRTPEEVLSEKVLAEKQWRDSELLRTDPMALIPDYPLKGNLGRYRMALRDYPATVDFPNGVRPVMSTDLKITILSKFEFLSRFTQAELGTIIELTKTNPAISIWMELFKVAEYIDIESIDTMQGVGMLEAGGIIAVGRSAEILA